MERQRKELDGNHFVTTDTKLVFARFFNCVFAKLRHLPLNMSLCESPEQSNIKWRSRQKRPVTFGIHYRFTVLFLLPSCCVSSLLSSTSPSLSSYLASKLTLAPWELFRRLSSSLSSAINHHYRRHQHHCQPSWHAEHITEKWTDLIINFWDIDNAHIFVVFIVPSPISASRTCGTLL